MIKIENLKDLPYKIYTAWLLKSEDDLTEEEKVSDSYLYISHHPKMIILFTEFIEEISGKVVRETPNHV